MAATGISRATFPLELSFRNIDGVEKIRVCVSTDQEEKGEIVREEKTAEELAAKAAAGVGPKGSDGEEEEPLEPKKKEYSAVRLDNNSLTDVSGLSEALQSVVIDVGAIRWLDLSFNRIKDVGPGSLDAMPNLYALYLHANEIDTLKDVQYIAKTAPHITGLTLHGNPIREIENYRLTIIAMFPKLTKLDFVPITPREREQAKRFFDAKGGKFSMRRIAAPGPSPIPSLPGSNPREAALIHAEPGSPKKLSF